MDLRRITEAVLLPVALLVALNIALILVSPAIPAGLLFLISHIPYLVGIYAGYRVSRGHGGIREAAAGGAVTLSAGLLLNTLLFFLLLRTGLIDIVAGLYGAAGAVIAPGTNAICLIMSLAVFAAMGALPGAIGGFIAERGFIPSGAPR